MAEHKIGRREAARRTLGVLGAAAFGGSVFAACGSKQEEGFSCMDTNGLSPAEVGMRNAQNYVDHSPHGEEKHCANCNLYQAAQSETQCGGCRVIKGPVHPEGYCGLWAAKS